MENFIVEKTMAQTEDATAIALAYLLQDVYNSLKGEKDGRVEWIMERFIEDLPTE